LRIRNIKSQTILMILIALTIGAKELCASELPQVQILTENLQLGESHYYNFSNLKKGDTIYVNMERISGNLDPIIGITKDRSDLSSFEDFLLKFELEVIPKHRVLLLRLLRLSRSLGWFVI